MFKKILKHETARRDAVLGAALEQDFGTTILQYETAKSAGGEFSSDEDVQNAINKTKNDFEQSDEAAADELEKNSYTEAGEDLPVTDNEPYHSTADYTMVPPPSADDIVPFSSNS